MKSKSLRRTTTAAILTGLSVICWLPSTIPSAKAQQAAPVNTAVEPARQAQFTTRLVAELPGYEGPSSFNARPALVTFSPDGRIVAISGEGRTVRLFDSAMGRPRATLAVEKGGVNGFAFSTDSRVAATRSLLDHSVGLWDVETGKLRLTLAGRKHDVETKFKASLIGSPEFFGVALSPDGGTVLTEREDDVVAAWDAATGKQLATLEHRTETSAAKDVLKLAIPFSRFYPLLMSASFSPDGRRVVTANGDRAPKLWDTSTWQLVATLSGPYDRTYAATFLPGGRVLMTFSIKGEVNLWDATTGKLKAALVGTRGRTYATAFSRDGRLVAAQVDDETLIFDASDGKQVTSIKKNRANLLAFSPDERVLATAGGDGKATAKLWDASTGDPKLALAKPDDDVHSIEFSPDGRLLLTTSDKGVRLWDAATGALLVTLERARHPAHFSPDSHYLVTGGTKKIALIYELAGQ